MSRIQTYPVGNSHTPIPFAADWLVLDVGSGHNPNPRSDVLADRFVWDDAERSGQKIRLPDDNKFVQADGAALPFADHSFDFVICSHVLEHVPSDSLDAFCRELNRVAKAGYIETPSKWAEILRHAPNHRWFASVRQGVLTFEPIAAGYPLGWFGKLFFSLYFYRNIQSQGRDVFSFAYGVRKPWHYGFALLRLGLVRLWRLAKPLTYTRLRWQHDFRWQVHIPPDDQAGDHAEG